MSDENEAKLDPRLKECPLCGGAATLFVSKEHGIALVECSQCGLRRHDRTEAWAIENWNSRVGDEEQNPTLPDAKAAISLLQDLLETTSGMERAILKIIEFVEKAQGNE